MSLLDDDDLERIFEESDQRSPLFNWMDLHYERIARLMERKRIRWAPLIQHLAAQGIRDGRGNIPSGYRMSATWRNVCKLRERERWGRRGADSGQERAEARARGGTALLAAPLDDKIAGVPPQAATSSAPADPGPATRRVDGASAGDRPDVQVSPSLAATPRVAAPSTRKAVAKKPLTPAQRQMGADFLASASRQDRGTWHEHDRRKREEQEAAYTVALANHLSERLGVRWEVWNERTYVILEGACSPKDGDDGLPRLWIKGEVLTIETVEGEETPLPEGLRAQLETVKAAVAKVCGTMREEKRRAGAAVAGGLASPSHVPASKEAPPLATREPSGRGGVVNTTPTQVPASAGPEIELTDEEKAVAFGFIDWQVKRDGRGSLSEWNRRGREERQAAERRLAEPGRENR